MFGARLFFILAVIVGSTSAYELGLFNGTTTEEVRVFCSEAAFSSSSPSSSI